MWRHQLHTVKKLPFIDDIVFWMVLLDTFGDAMDATVQAHPNQNEYPSEWLKRIYTVGCSHFLTTLHFEWPGPS